MKVISNFKTKLNGYDVELVKYDNALQFFCNGSLEEYAEFKEDLAALDRIKDSFHPFEKSIYDCFGMLIRSIDLISLYKEIT